MESTTTNQLPATASNLIIRGREFVVTGPVQHSSFRTWTLSGPNGAIFQVVQHTEPKYRATILRPFAWRTGRDLYIKGLPALVRVVGDDLEAVGR
jgi:hypothetical protein